MRKRKWLSFLLAVMMLVSATPFSSVTAGAADGTVEVSTWDELKRALEYTTNCSVVKVIADIETKDLNGPQGRELRAPLADPELNQKIEAFEYNGLRVNNFEMESSALAGLSLLLGHKALTCCMVIANRRALSANTGYKSTIDNLIKVVLDRI